MKDLHKVLGLVLPTNNPTLMMKDFIPSLDNFKEVKDVSTFLINFQHPFDADSIRECVSAIEEKGFKVIWEFNRYQIKSLPEIPVTRIRNDTARLMGDAMIYALIDDDFQFRGPSPKMEKSAGRQYLDILHYFMTFDDCGTVLIGGSMYKTVPTYHIGLVDINNTYLTAKGFLVRNLAPYAYIVPTDAEWVLGCDEEKIAAAARLNRGLFTAKMRMGRTLHYEVKGKIPSAEFYRWNEFDVVENNATKYIRENFNPEFKGNLTGKGGGNYYNVVSYERYLEAGGIPVEETFIGTHTLNYREVSEEEIIHYIDEIYQSM